MSQRPRRRQAAAGGAVGVEGPRLFRQRGAPERLAHVFEVPPLRRVVSLRVRTTQACWYRDTITRSSLQTSLSRIICILMVPLDLLLGRRRLGVRSCSERHCGERPCCGRPRFPDRAHPFAPAFAVAYVWGSLRHLLALHASSRRGAILRFGRVAPRSQWRRLCDAIRVLVAPQVHSESSHSKS